MNRTMNEYDVLPFLAGPPQQAADSSDNKIAINKFLFLAYQIKSNMSNNNCSSLFSIIILLILLLNSAYVPLHYFFFHFMIINTQFFVVVDFELLFTNNNNIIISAAFTIAATNKNSIKLISPIENVGSRKR